MRVQWASFEFRMELRTEEKWVDRTWELGDFHELAVGRFAGEHESGFFYFFYKILVHFISMSVTFRYLFTVVCFASDRSITKYTRICAQAHRGAVIAVFHMFFLFWHDIDYHMRTVRIYLRRMLVFPTNHITAILDNRELHTVAETQIWNLVLPGIFDRHDHPFNSRLPETA